MEQKNVTMWNIIPLEQNMRICSNGTHCSFLKKNHIDGVEHMLRKIYFICSTGTKKCYIVECAPCIWNLLFSYEFLENNFASQLLLQSTSNVHRLKYFRYLQL